METMPPGPRPRTTPGLRPNTLCLRRSRDHWDSAQTSTPRAPVPTRPASASAVTIGILPGAPAPRPRPRPRPRPNTPCFCERRDHWDSARGSRPQAQAQAQAQAPTRPASASAVTTAILPGAPLPLPRIPDAAPSGLKAAKPGCEPPGGTSSPFTGKRGWNRPSWGRLELSAKTPDAGTLHHWGGQPGPRPPATNVHWS